MSNETKNKIEVKKLILKAKTTNFNLKLKLILDIKLFLFIKLILVLHSFFSLMCEKRNKHTNIFYSFLIM